MSESNFSPKNSKSSEARKSQNNSSRDSQFASLPKREAEQLHKIDEESLDDEKNYISANVKPINSPLASATAIDE